MNNKKNYWIGGYHAVQKAIENKKRKVLKLILNSEHKNREIFFHNTEVKNNKFFNKIFDNEDFAHQGYAAQIENLDQHNCDIKNYNKNIDNFIALDGVIDPRNIGSIIRNCVAFNFFNIIINKKEFNEKSAAMYKAASGAMEKINLYPCSNIINPINLLKESGYQIIGLDGNANTDITNHKWDKKNVIILGSESSGMRNIIKDNCDELIKIDINPYRDSLNVSNASAALLMYLKYTLKI
jgi:23S rRNA (guanosine2251-2'-O)-methyltransferase